MKPPNTVFQCLGVHVHEKHLVLDTGKKGLQKADLGDEVCLFQIIDIKVFIMCVFG